MWGGLLVALLGAWGWAGWARGDRLARHLTLWGMLGGLGFPLGQCLQSWHAWNRDLFTTGIWAALDPTLNWWNWMETTFGAVMGACLGLGLWLNRRSIGDGDDHLDAASRSWLEWTLVCVHVTLLVVAEFTAIAWANALYDPGLVIAFIPFVAVASGRWWPVLLLLPITLVPIAGKTIRSLVYQSHAIGPAAGWMLYGVLPVLMTTAVACWFLRQATRASSGREFARIALVVNVWLYFGLNYAFARFPWPWQPWTTRTPNSLVFFACAVGLTVACWRIGRVEPGKGSDPGRLFFFFFFFFLTHLPPHHPPTPLDRSQLPPPNLAHSPPPNLNHLPIPYLHQSFSPLCPPPTAHNTALTNTHALHSIRSSLPLPYLNRRGLTPV